jgi:hypothetical protein
MNKFKAWPASCAAGILLAATACGGSTAEFTLSKASVDPDHPCAPGASNVPYNVGATVAGHNGTSSPVSISAVSAVMTLAEVHGGWLQTVGYRYEAANVAFTPDRIGAGSSATFNVTIPSACTNPSKSPGSASYGDYSVSFKFTTSAGTFNVVSGNRHRISTS